jgi:two-component system response regulator NreC
MRILIADDHAIVREGLRSLSKFYEDLEVCGEASNGEEAVQKAIELQPHLVILDVTMPVLNGFRAAKKINELKVPILMLSMHDGEECGFRARWVQAASWPKPKLVEFCSRQLTLLL